MWSEHCSYKSSSVHLKTSADARPSTCWSGPGRERRRRRDRRRPRGRSSRSRATTTPPSSSRRRARRPAWAASCATSSRWARARSRRSTRSASARSTIRSTAPAATASSHGIGGYGNSVGVATVGGETSFHECYRGNILVNAFNLGLVEADGIFLAHAPRRRQPGDLRRLARPAATASTARACSPRPSSTTRARRSARPCRSATRSPRSV